MTDDIAHRLRDEEALEWNEGTLTRGDALEAADEIERLRVECARLRSWVDALEPQVSYEAVRCPICLQATEQRFMQPLEPHAEGCPWREANRQEPPC